MRIGFVIDDGLDRPDGVQQYVLTLGKWLTAKGHEVHYLAGETKRSDVPNLHSLSRNVTVKFNKNRATIPVSIKKKSINQLLDSKFDILHVQMPYSPILSGYIIKHAPSQTVIFGSFHIAPYSFFEYQMNKLFSITLKSSLTKFHTIISVSSAAQDFAEAILKKRTPIIPNMVDIAKYNNYAVKRPKNIVKVVFLGRLVHRKGAKQLLNALDLLNRSKKLINVKVLIGGTGPLLKKLQQYVKSCNLGDVVRFSGFIEEENKAKYLNSADIAVFPSLGGESFGIILIEAMAARSGLVLGGDNPGYRTVLDNPEMIVHPNHIGIFAEELYKYIIDPALRKKLHSQQQKIVKIYDVNVVGEKIEKLYSQALHSTQAMR